MSNAQKVLDFHRAVYAEAPAVPTPPSRDLLALRLTLIREEVAEVEDAAQGLDRQLAKGDAADLTPLAHELVDLLYVTYGALLALGTDPDAVFAEVHRANLAKTSGPKRLDGKQLKPEGWQPADVRGVLARLTLERT